MTTNVSTNLKKDSRQLLWIGILLVLLGVVAIATPAFSTLVTETWIAFILISAGTAKLFYAFRTQKQGGFLWKLLLSVLYIATGIMLLVYPLTGILTLTLLLGSFLLTEGVFELLLAFRLRPQQNWTAVLVDGVITLILGGIVWLQWPSNAVWVLGIVVGASILSTGISRIMLSLQANSALNQADSGAADAGTSA